MERLTFSSAADLDSYCERLRSDLTSKSDEQRRLIEAALERLDELEAHAQAVRSDQLAAEISERRAEARQMLAALPSAAAAVSAPEPATAVLDLPPLMTAESSEPQLVAESTLELGAQRGANGYSAPASFVDPMVANPEPTAIEAPAQEPPAPEEAVIAALPKAAAPQIEALWAQPVDPRPAPELPSFEATDNSISNEPEPAPAAFGAFGVPSEPLPASDAEAAPDPLAEIAQVPPTKNWGWGPDNESPAWAALLVEDTPVPVEPLSDSHFVHAPPLSVLAAETVPPEIEAPPAIPEAPSPLKQLVLNVKVGEWGSAYPLSKPELLIGRRDLATRCMPDVEVRYDQAVSRRHLRIVRDNGSYLVEDLNSTNGTTLNGHSLAPGRLETLNAGDELEIGEFTLLQIAAA